MPQNVGSIEDLIREPFHGKPSTSAIKESNFIPGQIHVCISLFIFFHFLTCNLYTKELKFQVLSLIL